MACRHTRSYMRLMSNIFTSSICLIICLSFSFAMCTSCTRKTQMAPAVLNATDRTFLNTVGEYNLSQIELGNMAITEAANPTLQQFGETLATDHTAGQQELEKIACLVRHQLPGKAGQHHEDLKQSLLVNKEHFDSLYIQAQHERFIAIKAALEQELVQGMQQDVKNYAGALLKEVNEYIRIADSFAGKY